MKIIGDAICWMLCCYLTYLIIRWFTATPIYDDPSERKEKLSNWNTLLIAISLRIIKVLFWRNDFTIELGNGNDNEFLGFKSNSNPVFEKSNGEKWKSVGLSFHFYFTIIFIPISSKINSTSNSDLLSGSHHRFTHFDVNMLHQSCVKEWMSMS